MRDYYLNQLGITPWVLRKKEKEICSSSSFSLFEKLATRVAACRRCPLHQSRTQTVFARGKPSAKLMIIGEAPGFYEDQQGLPFVGKAGELLNHMIAAIGFSESDVYIANVLKCRPPDNRDPQPFEIEQCSDYLTHQIEYINPSVILAVGRFAGQFLLKTTLSMAKMRSKIHHYRDIQVLVSYHPAYLLRNPLDKRHAYQDWLQVKQLLKSRSS